MWNGANSWDMFERELKAYAKMFSERERPDGEGIPIADVCGLMRDMGWSVDKYPDELLLGWFTPRDDQTLDFGGFRHGVVSNSNGKEVMRARATRFYNGCDVDNNGGMTKDDLKKFCQDNEKEFGVNKDMCEQFVEYFDKNADGSMQLREFWMFLGCPDEDSA